MLKVYRDEMSFFKDELGGKTEKDCSDSAENAEFTQNITAMEMQGFVQIN
ncbi:hypothetical protein J7E76_16690 [Bacillus sp. ISL-101]|nr:MULTISPECIES: hypothetical protein [unclassified Bacillus (in: firmicutes)]MBT2630723.1 hypothetical protein [Bacillus sp. ISL-101]MBT2716662.1 hypothetical protein [Bacillus sp. ISL-57]